MHVCGALPHYFTFVNLGDIQKLYALRVMIIAFIIERFSSNILNIQKTFLFQKLLILFSPTLAGFFQISILYHRILYVLLSSWIT